MGLHRLKGFNVAIVDEVGLNQVVQGESFTGEGSEGDEIPCLELYKQGIEIEDEGVQGGAEEVGRNLFVDGLQAH